MFSAKGTIVEPLTARVREIDPPFIYIEVSAILENEIVQWKEALGIALRVKEGAFKAMGESASLPFTVVPLPSNGNLLYQIESDELNFAKLVEEKTDFHQEDQNFWTMEKKMLILNPSAEILYHDDCNSNSGAYRWMRLHLIGSDTPVEDLESVVEALGFQRFQDEDASNGIFSRDNEAYCYISFEFRSGWWENHTLPEGNGVAPYWKG